jgi:hypothetical protein
MIKSRKKNTSNDVRGEQWRAAMGAMSFGQKVTTGCYMRREEHLTKYKARHGAKHYRNIRMRLSRKTPLAKLAQTREFL